MSSQDKERLELLQGTLDLLILRTLIFGPRIPHCNGWKTGVGLPLTRGLVIAFEGTRFILNFAFPRVGGMGRVPIEASPSIPILLFTFVLSLVTGIVFGIAPAWMASRVDPIEALRGANRSTIRSSLTSPTAHQSRKGDFSVTDLH